MEGISRRNFLKGAGIGGAGLAAASALAACSPTVNNGGGDTGASGNTGDASSTATWRIAPDPIAASDIVETADCDVLVLGLGNAGAAAMRGAAETGAKVYAFHDTSEDAHFFRGGGQIGHINSQFLASKGVPKVDVREFVNDWQVRSNNRSNPGLIRNYANHCGEAFDWYFGYSLDVSKVGFWKDGYQGPNKRDYGGVLGADWRPIKGLFAAGNASGDRFGWQYFTSIAGQSLSMATTMGGVTGAHVASGKPISELTLL